MTRTVYIILTLVLLFRFSYSQPEQPNILLIIADDLGIDAIDGFDLNTQIANTPTLDGMRASGITYSNVWAAPQCTPTRAAIMSGKYGVKTGVMRPPGNLELVHTSIFQEIANRTGDVYNAAVIGKWHISDPVDYNHPEQHGIAHYEGLFTSSVDDYYNWEKVVDGALTTSTTYVTTDLTNSAINWISTQNQDEPWFLWLAHVAPHSPFHIPPTGLFSIENTDTNADKYVAAIEAMDTEIGRLLENISEDVLANTVVIFIGDNGTPNQTLQYYPTGHGKGTLYEGGIRVPMIITGSGVTRQGSTEEGLSQVTDLYASILDLASEQLPGGIHNSLSIVPSFSCKNSIQREFNYVDYQDGSLLKWAIRNERYKLIQDETGNQELYDLSVDLKEEFNLLSSLTPEQEELLTIFEMEAVAIRNGWSCNDGIQNGAEVGIDDCESNCTTVDALSTENIGCCAEPESPSVFYEYVEGDNRNIYTNDYPNHNFCYNPNQIPEESYHFFSIDRSPQLTGEITKVVRDNGRPARFFGVAKNGVIMAPAPAVPFIFENPSTGEYNWDWVFEPTNNQGDGMQLVALDCASGHTSSQGYHYHGEMFEYLETLIPGVTNAVSAPAEPIHIGWAADGFPIVYKFGPNVNRQMKELRPSYQLKSGLRPGDDIESPCGAYTGKYTNDYEYLCGKGDLDECNGINSQIDIVTSLGVESFEYYYVVTSSFPQISRCLMGSVSPDFDNNTDDLEGVDNDGDGFISQFDCDDNNADINPNAIEIEGNEIDEDCNGLLTASSTIELKGFSVGPNPSFDGVRVQGEKDEEFRVILYDVAGRRVFDFSGFSEIIMPKVSAGVYIIKIFVGSKLVHTEKIISL